MKKTIMAALLMLSVLVLSAVGTTYPIEYEDRSCTEQWVKHGWHWEWEEVCVDDDRETSVDVPETDLSPVESRVSKLESNTGKSWSAIWERLTGEKTNDYFYMTFFDWLKGSFVLRSEFEQYKEQKQQEMNNVYSRLHELEKETGLYKGTY